jgi:outer membrane protein assembly factor BamB
MSQLLSFLSAPLRRIRVNPRPLFFLALLSAIAVAEDWPVVRGNTNATGVAQSELADELELKWEYTTEDSAFEATPVIVAGVVYIGDADGTFHAVELATGEAKWTQKFEDAGFVAAAAVKDDALYVGDYNGMVRRLSTADGKQAWEFDAETEVYAGPSLSGENVLITTEGGVLFCLNVADGKEVWRFTIEAPLRCSPIVVNGRALLAGCDGKLHAVDVSTGKEVTSLAIDGPTGSTPAIVEGVAYFGGESGLFQAIDVPADDDMKLVWKYKDPRRGQGIRSAAAVNDDVVIYGSQGKAVYCLTRGSGERKWQLTDRTRIESSPVIAGDRAVVATASGKLLLVNITDGEKVWDYDAGGGFQSSPAVVDGHLVIGNDDGTLYCFGSKN